jgi:hypothetical protein
VLVRFFRSDHQKSAWGELSLDDNISKVSPMNKLFVRATAGTIALALVGCATRPDNVIAHHVSTVRYDAYDCKRLVREADEVRARIRQLTGSLESKANTDAVLVGVGLILFWPALLALPATGGKPEEQELGRLKGEAEALQRAYKEKDCGSQAVQASRSSADGAAPTATGTATPVSTGR